MAPFPAISYMRRAVVKVKWMKGCKSSTHAVFGHTLPLKPLSLLTENNIPCYYIGLVFCMPLINRLRAYLMYAPPPWYEKVESSCFERRALDVKYWKRWTLSTIAIIIPAKRPVKVQGAAAVTFWCALALVVVDTILPISLPTQSQENNRNVCSWQSGIQWFELFRIEVILHHRRYGFVL